MFFSSCAPVPEGQSINQSINDERRAVAKALTDALYAYLTWPIAEMERAQRAQSNAPRFTVEGLVRMQGELEKRRTVLEANRDKLERVVADVPEGMKELAAAQIEAILIEPLEREIEGLESYISQVQAELEKMNPAV